MPKERRVFDWSIGGFDCGRGDLLMSGLRQFQKSKLCLISPSIATADINLLNGAYALTCLQMLNEIIGLHSIQM